MEKTIEKKEVEMMECPTCKKEVAGDASVCQHCGEEFAESVDTSADMVVERIHVIKDNDILLGFADVSFAGLITVKGFSIKRFKKGSEVNTFVFEPQNKDGKSGKYFSNAYLAKDKRDDLKRIVLKAYSEAL